MSNKLAVCALIFDINGKVLTVSRKDDPYDIGLPGGKVDHGETLNDALKREVLEETGFTVHVVKDVYVEVESPHGYTAYTFLCVIDGTVKHQPLADHETGVVSMKYPNELLQNGCTFKDYNKRLFQHLNLISI